MDTVHSRPTRADSRQRIRLCTLYRLTGSTERPRGLLRRLGRQLRSGPPVSTDGRGRGGGRFRVIGV